MPREKQVIKAANEGNELKQPRAPKTSAPQPPATVPVNAMPIETPGTQMKRPPGFRAPTPARPQMGGGSGVLPPVPVPLETIQRDFGPMTQNLKEVMQEHQRTLPSEQQTGYFWQGFSAYPEAMAQMIVRRAWANRMVATGPVAEFMAKIEGVRRG